MLSTTCALHIESQQHDLLGAECRGQVDRLKSRVAAPIYCVRLRTEAFALAASNPVRTELVARHLADAPHLALEVREDLRRVDLPEPVVRGVEHICPGGELERRVDDDQLRLAPNEV